MFYLCHEKTPVNRLKLIKLKGGLRVLPQHNYSSHEYLLNAKKKKKKGRGKKKGKWNNRNREMPQIPEAWILLQK